MNKDLIELQRGCPATAVIVFKDDYKKLENTLVMKADVDDKYLFGLPCGYPVFKDKLDVLAKAGKLVYFVISGIDKISADKQNRFIGLVKDREFEGYILPKNCIIVFTTESKQMLKNISSELFHFCVVA